MTRASQATSQLAEIIDFAVEYDLHSAVIVGHWLVPARNLEGILQ
jgi:hypothetical protein